jgi:hypothetical protein
MDLKDTMFRFMERLYETSPELFWIVVGSLCGLFLLIWVCGIVVDTIAKIKLQQFQKSEADHRLLVWMRVGGFVVLSIASFPVLLVFLVVIFLWAEFKSARQFFLES